MGSILGPSFMETPIYWTADPKDCLGPYEVEQPEGQLVHFAAITGEAMLEVTMPDPHVAHVSGRSLAHCCWGSRFATVDVYRK